MVTSAKRRCCDDLPSRDGQLPSPACGGGWPKAGRGFRTKRRAAPLVKNGGEGRERLVTVRPQRGGRQAPVIGGWSCRQSVVIARSSATWQSSSFHAERIDADFFVVENGQAFPSFTPSLVSGAARRMVGSPLPPFGHPPPQAGEERFIGRTRHCESLPHLVIARSESTWQSSSFHAERIDAVFSAAESGRRPVLSSPFLSSGAARRMKRTGLPRACGPRNDEFSRLRERVARQGRERASYHPARERRWIKGEKERDARSRPIERTSLQGTGIPPATKKIRLLSRRPLCARR
jgi:hypothetical protein